MPNQIILAGFSEFKDKLKNLPANLLREVDAEVFFAAKDWEARAKRDAPKDQGRLVNEIRAVRIKPGSVEIVNNSEYAPYMEWGTKSRAVVPADLAAYASQFRGRGSGGNAKKMIYEWCRRVGIPPERWFLVYRSIMEHGVKPHPYFFKHEPVIQANLIRAVRNIINTEH